MKGKFKDFFPSNLKTNYWSRIIKTYQQRRGDNNRLNDSLDFVLHFFNLF